ncbi:MAG: beta-lactamase family protein [Planctomycetes bacterium]|nr:beta-lactamase family protein [Planctomycetota bacterium]
MRNSWRTRGVAGVGLVLCAWLVCLGGPTQAADKTPRLAPALQPFVDRHELAGAVLLVADKQAILDVETVGVADIAQQKPMRPDSLFWIASMSKPITATALMLLVDEGLVKIEDPVEKFLPEFKNLWVPVERSDDRLVLKRPAHPITVREILTHTSGLDFRSEMEQPRLDGLKLCDAVRSYTLAPLLWEPGTKFKYSNAGINTAGRIIEVVSEMPFEEFLDRRVFKPLGMKDTTFWPNAEQLTRLAKAYQPNAAKNDLEEMKIEQLTYPLDDRTRGPMPAGGLFSTAHDCAHLCQMALAGGLFEGRRFLSEEAVQQMTKRQTGAGISENWGLGWTAGPSFGHGGALSTNMTVDTQRGLIFIYLVQHAGYAGTNGAQIYPAFVDAAVQAFGK